MVTLFAMLNAWLRVLIIAVGGGSDVHC